MTGPVGDSPVYNRQSQVLVAPHPDCRACPSYADLLEQQIVANGVLRLLVMDLRAALRKAGGTYDLEQHDTTLDAVARHPACTHCGAELVLGPGTREEDTRDL